MSSSGKTVFVMNLISNIQKMTSPQINHILYVHGQNGDHIPVLQRAGIETTSVIPSDEKLSTQPKPFLLVIDDYLSDLNSKWISDVYTKKAHHMGFFVITIAQDLFDPKLKVPRLNSHYIVLLRSPNAARGVRDLAVQLFPGKVKEFIQIFEHATQEPYKYLMIDLHPITNPKIRLRKSIFPDEITGVYQFD